MIEIFVFLTSVQQATMSTRAEVPVVAEVCVFMTTWTQTSRCTSYTSRSAICRAASCVSKTIFNAVFTVLIGNSCEHSAKCLPHVLLFHMVES